MIKCILFFLSIVAFVSCYNNQKNINQNNIENQSDEYKHTIRISRTYSIWVDTFYAIKGSSRASKYQISGFKYNIYFNIENTNMEEMVRFAYFVLCELPDGKEIIIFLKNYEYEYLYNKDYSFTAITSEKGFAFCKIGYLENRQQKLIPGTYASVLLD